MTEDEDRIRQRQVSRAVQKAFKELMKNIASEPALVIEPDEGESGLSEEAMADIGKWLFQRRE